MLKFDDETRAQLWAQVIAEVERYQLVVRNCPVSPLDTPGQIKQSIAAFDFSAPRSAGEVVKFAAEQLTRNQVHTPSPHYFGLFNPAPSDMSIYADSLVAAFNPQLAAWNHSPFAVEVETHLIQSIGRKLGFSANDIDGTFTSGGAEANHTAVLCALTDQFDQFRQHGLRSLPGQPTLYVSSEAHHSISKAARLCGLGTESVRQVPVDDSLLMDLDRLEHLISKDRQAGCMPFLVVGTAGTTSAGAIDPLSALAALCRRHRMWYHVDAAWGGAAMLVPELRPLLAGIELADSITFDCHKWLSVAMGAGLYLTKHVDVLDNAFRIATDYMPKDGTQLGLTDPYAHSMQWSRRFIGLKVFMSLAVAGWDGYATVLSHQAKMGDLLRGQLRDDGWRIVNETLLPLVCFTGRDAAEQEMAFLERICKDVVGQGKAWISTTRIGSGRPVLRACITNYDSGVEDVEELVELVGIARQKACKC